MHPRARRKRPGARGRLGPVLLLTLLAPMALGIGCAGGPRPGRPGVEAVAAPPAPGQARESSGLVYATLDEAAVAALRSAYRETPRADRRVRLGSIRRTRAGFTYSVAVMSREEIDSVRRVEVRHRLSPGDVASYVVHPSTGVRLIDRLNESPSRSERRLVERADPQHRPLYVLTPSLRILRVQLGPSGIRVVGREPAEGRLRSTLHAQSR